MSLLFEFFKWLWLFLFHQLFLKTNKHLEFILEHGQFCESFTTIVTDSSWLWRQNLDLLLTKYLQKSVAVKAVPRKPFPRTIMMCLKVSLRTPFYLQLWDKERWNDDRQSQNCAVSPWNQPELLLVTSVSLAIIVAGSFAVFLTACCTDRSQECTGWCLESRAEIGADKRCRIEKETNCSCPCSIKLSFLESWPLPMLQWLLWSLFTLHVMRTGCRGKPAIARSIGAALAICSCIVFFIVRTQLLAAARVLIFIFLECISGAFMLYFLPL